MSDTVQQIKDKLDIVDVISGYVELHKAGKNFKGRSPFSNEKTPSFYVSPDRGMYYCFSTSQGGDIFTFIQTMEGVDFKEALKLLAAKAGVELVSENLERKSERDRLYAILNEATKYFSQELKNSKEAKDYLEKRGVTDKTIGIWQIGYAPGPPKRGWREVRNHLNELGYTDTEMIKAGVVKTTDSGKEPFDVFRDRVMFPMAEQNGKVVAYSGRILAKDSDAPKYVNSPETELYKKSELLFGYDKAKHGIRTLDFSLIVEGQFDVVMCHQAGYANAVAVSGTALTPHHVSLLERLSSKVLLALDADRAGIAAMKRAAELMLRRGFDVKVAAMPEGKDPADMIVADVKEFKKVIGKSQHVIEYLLDLLKEGTSDERNYSLQVREEILPIVVQIPNHIDQEIFVKKIAEKLAVSKESIQYEIDRIAENQTKPKPAQSMMQNSGIKTDNKPASTTRMTALGNYLVVAAEVLSDNYGKKIKEALESIYDKKYELLKENIPVEEASKLSFTIDSQIESVTKRDLNEDLVHRLNVQRDMVLKWRISEFRMQLGETKDDEKINKILDKIKHLQGQIQLPSYTIEMFD